MHNRCVSVSDKPVHHPVDSYLACAAYIHHLATATTSPTHVEPDTATQGRAAGPSACLRGHDHDGAYRQLPVQNPSHAYMLLLTPAGPTLWRHNVLLFGAVASVWGYNRFGDAICFLARALLASPVLHYLDDYGSSEPLVEQFHHMPTASNTAASAFESFASMNSLLGFFMKPSKAQPPAACHRVQGVQLRLLHDRSIVSPTPSRVTKVNAFIELALTENRLTPSSAAELGGKCTYLSTSIYGRVGREATKPVYARQHSANLNPHRRSDAFTLTMALRSALLTIQYILRNAKPRVQQYLTSHVHHTVIYADAFFLMGERQYRPSDTNIPTDWDAAAASHYTNGWGAVVFLPTDSGHHAAFCLRGEVPAHVLAAFCSRRAFIYFLEAWAQVLCCIAFEEWITPDYIAVVDNEAAKYALIKGYGRDCNINAIISIYWAPQADQGWRPWMHRVSSADNISDEVSRNDFTMAKALNWHRVHIDTEDIYKIILRAADNILFAHTHALQQLQMAVRDQPFRREVRAILAAASRQNAVP